jgi:hypothetical protein
MLRLIFALFALGVLALGCWIWYSEITRQKNDALEEDGGDRVLADKKRRRRFDDDGGEKEKEAMMTEGLADDPAAWSAPDTRQLSCLAVPGSAAGVACVRDRPNKEAAAELLATIVDRCAAFVARLVRDHPHHPASARLRERFDPARLMETLPRSAHTAFSENKGEKVALCLTPDKDASVAAKGLVDDHTLFFVALHELAHVGTASMEDHDDSFWATFAFLLACAEEQGLHDPVDYRKHPARYCGMQISDNPLITRREAGLPVK